MSRRDIVEIFGHSPTDLSHTTRQLWKDGLCPFINGPCIKFNHDKSIIYGTCSVTSPRGEVVICPNRFYADEYSTIRKVAEEAFGPRIPFLLSRGESAHASVNDCVVAIGKGSGGEIKIGSVSMDWVLVHVENGRIIEYCGIEVQSIDITGNYRDAWKAYRDYKKGTPIDEIPSSKHGLNWANVHKRLIPQLIRKGVVYSSSKYASKGLFFIVPDQVFNKFEEIVGNIPTLEAPRSGSLTIHTYALSLEKSGQKIRDLDLKRKLTVDLDDFALGFIEGRGLPSSQELDQAVEAALGIPLG